MKNLGLIKSIEAIFNFELGNHASVEGKNGVQLGLASVINTIFGRRSMDGYKVVTEGHEVLVLIDNVQSCCESWGSIQSEDDLQRFIGAELQDVELTDIGCNKRMLDEAESIYEGGIQFIDFLTSEGSFQLAVYNSHNGYYGHGIIVAIDNEIICDTTL